MRTFTEQILGIVQHHRQTQQGGDGGEGDVALAPVEFDLEFAVFAPEDPTVGQDRPRV
jgi:hypothetical protein